MEVFSKWWSKVPLLGYLALCTGKNHLEALREMLITLVFSTITFWVTALLLLPFQINTQLGYLGLLEKTVNAGQLFIFAVSFMGPIFLLAGDDPPKARAFPSRGLHFVVLVLLAIVSSAFYALQLGSKQSPEALVLDADFLLKASIVVAISAVALRYLTMVYRKNTLSFDPNVELEQPVDEFAKRFAERHK